MLLQYYCLFAYLTVFTVSETSSDLIKSETNQIEMSFLSDAIKVVEMIRELYKIKEEFTANKQGTTTTST